MRPGRLARSFRFAAPSIGAVAVAVVAAGLHEGWIERASFAATLCGAGAAAALVGPVLLALSLGVRGLWRAWRPFLVDGPDHGDGSPAKDASSPGARLFGGALHALVAALLLGAVGFAATFAALADPGPAGGPRPSLDPLSIAAIAAAASLVLLAAARPAAAALARPGARLGLHRPRAALNAIAILIAVLSFVVWIAVAGPALAKVDYGFAGYGWTAAVMLVLAHASVRWMGPRARRLMGGGAVVACAALVVYAASARADDPGTVFDAWYRLPVGGLALGALVDVDALRSESAPADLAPQPRPGAAHPDVVVVTIDTVRADALRLYGGAAATPALDRLAARGRVYQWAFSPSNNTRQSVSSIMTGLSPARLRGRVVEFGLKLDPRHVVVGERFRAAGYDTAGFLCCPNHLGGRKKIGLDRGLAEVRYDRSGERLAADAIAWLRAGARTQRPRYAWIHMFEPHDWQRGSDDPGKEAAAAAYRRAIERTDAYLGAILHEVERSARPTLVVVTSDHGEGLGDRGALHHASNLYNSQTRVPLVVAGPGIPPGRDAAPVGLLDLAPTLLDLAGYDPPATSSMDGRSFAARARGGAPRPGTADDEAYAVMIRDRSVQRAGRALVAGTYKLIQMDGKRPELYDLAADPAEARNLASKKPAITADLQKRLERRRVTDGEEPFR